MRKVLEVLGLLEDADIDWLVAHGVRCTVAAGARVIEAGVPLDSVYILLDGCLRVAVDDVEVATLGSGEIVGEISFVDPRPPGASVFAMSTVHLLAVPRSLLKRHLADDTAFAARFYYALAASLASRLRQTTSQLGYGSAKTAPDPDELEPSELEEVSLAAVRFDRMLRRLSAA